MDILLAVVAGLLIVAGIAGSVLPLIPGPPLSFVGVLTFHFTSYANFSLTFLIITGVIAVAITVLDYFIPSWGTKKFGGSTFGKKGALIGVFAGMFFFPPIGIVLGPYVGALIAELVHDKNDFSKAFKSAFGSLIGFLLGTGLKLMFGLVLTYIYIKELIF